jgi:hypothetical protein
MTGNADRGTTQHIRVSFARHDGTNDPHTGRTGDVRDEVMQLKVHLHKGLLHVLDVCCCAVDQTLALPHIGPQGGDLSPGAGSCRATGRKNATAAAIWYR